MTNALKNPWLTDVRVRDRNVKKGHFEQKDVDKFLAELPDVADHAEPIGIAQPALDDPEDDLDDEDDEDDEELSKGGHAMSTKTEDLPHIDFSTFIVSLSHSALVHLGDTNSAEHGVKDLALARQTIDILGVIQEKTKGNLTGEEERLLSQMLYDLRMRFVEVSRAT